MTKVLVVADASWVRNEVRATLTSSKYEIIDHSDPGTAASMAVSQNVDAVITDLQIGAMGGMAVTRSIREATGSIQSPGLPVVLLLDRHADNFLARRSGAAAWLTKPFTSRQLEQALEAALESRSYTTGPENGTGQASE